MNGRKKVVLPPPAPNPQPGSLTTKDLNQTQVDKHKANKEIYRYILGDCEKKIKFHNSLGNTQTILRIPYMLFDKPLYNITHAIMYVIRKLKKNGFVIGNVYENMIQISWMKTNLKE